MKRKFSLVMVLALLSFFIVLSCSSAAGVVITNSSSEGIKGSLGNDTINLVNGTYTGINNTNITIDNGRNIIIQSNNSNNKAIIDCDGSWFIYNSGNLTLKNLIIKNAYTDDYGGCVYNTGTLTIINCTFLNNFAASGGAIYNYFGKINIYDSVFDNNSAVDGGAIANDHGEINIYDSVFNSNYVYFSGGAIYNENGEQDNDMLDEFATFDGSGSINIFNSTFTNNEAQYYGGAIYNNDNGRISIQSSNFINNFADGGGAILSYNGRISIQSSNFINNSASYAGGAIFNNGHGSISIHNSDFINNSATDNGGAIANWYSEINISNSVFDNNSADYGGSISNYDSLVDMLVEFTGSGSINIFNSKLTNNSAQYGGAIYNSNGRISIQSSDFINNSATNLGGAICNDRLSIIHVIGSNFIDNTAISGGAIYNYIGHLDISYSRILNNTASAVHNNGSGDSVADFNWWGYNSPTLSTDYYGFTLINWFVASLNSVNSTVVIGSTVVLDYGFILSDDGDVNNSLLPNFVIVMDNGNDFDGRFNQSINYAVQSTTVNGIVDNQPLNVTFDLLYPNVTVDLSLDKDKMNISESVTGSVNVSNTGNGSAEGVIVVVQLPSNFTPTEYVNGTYDPLNNTLTWNITVESGSEQVLNFTGSFSDRGNYTFNSTTTLVNGSVLNNAANIEVILNASNISVDLTLDKDKVKVNDSVTGSVTVSNNGDISEADIIVVVQLPSNFTPTEYVNGTYDPVNNTLTWNITLGPDSELVLNFTGSFSDKGNYTFNSTTTLVNGSVLNNTAGIRVILNVSDVSVDLTLDRDKVKVNESVTGSVIVSNNGDGSAEGVIVVVSLPGNFIVTNPNGGVYDKKSHTLTWTINVGPDSKKVLNFTGEFTHKGNYTFNSTTTLANGSKINNAGDVEVIFNVSDVSVNLSLDKDKVKVNDSVTGSVIVSNNGNSTISNVTVVVSLPGNFVVTNPNGGVYDKKSHTLTWTINVGPGSKKVLSFTGKFTSKGNYTFTSKTTLNGFDIINTADMEVVDNSANDNNSNVVNAVSMKSTGIPVAVLLISLILVFVPFYRRNK
ncbi:MAG: beta strand repeat-containing protein [Methanobacteriaceae archaeon]